MLKIVIGGIAGAIARILTAKKARCVVYGKSNRGIDTAGIKFMEDSTDFIPDIVRIGGLDLVRYIVVVTSPRHRTHPRTWHGSCSSRGLHYKGSGFTIAIIHVGDWIHGAWTHNRRRLSAHGPADHLYQDSQGRTRGQEQDHTASARSRPRVLSRRRQVDGGRDAAAKRGHGLRGARPGPA